MTLEAIKAPSIPAAPHAVLFLWATPPMHPPAMGSWRRGGSRGFTYRTHLVWVKDRIGTGYWVRSRHELLLIGTGAKCPRQRRAVSRRR